MTLENFIEQLKTSPETVNFQVAITIIDTHYHYTPTAFDNGTIHNAADENTGSCKIFAFAKLHNLSEQQTLHCFGDFYRQDVLQNPEGTDHKNIRQFLETGWTGINYAETALKPCDEEQLNEET